MSGPITHYELGKSLHREYEAQASRYWGQDLTGSGESILTIGRKLALVIERAQPRLSSAASRLHLTH